MATTFATIGAKLASAEKKYTKQLENSKTVASANSAKLMLKRINERKNMLIADNDQLAVQGNASVPMFGGGGSNNPGIINGYDITRYATDPLHEAKIQSIYKKLRGITTPEQLDAYIRKIAPNSPLKAEDIYRIAVESRVDPNLITAIMQNDSTFGTKGKGARTFNPGNVGNDDTGREVNYGSWYNGIKAVADWLGKNRSVIKNAQDPFRVVPAEDVQPLYAPSVTLQQNTEAGRIGRNIANRTIFEDGTSMKPIPENINSGKAGTKTINELKSGSLKSVADFLASRNEAPGKLETDKLKDLTVNMGARASEDTKALLAEKGARRENVVTGAMGAMGTMGTFLDNIANKRMLNNLEAPAKPVLQNGIKLNTNYNIEPQVGELKSQAYAMNRGIDNTLSSRGTATAAKLAGFSSVLRGISELRAQKANAETQMRNTETMANAEINARNSAVDHNYRQAVTDFNNGKIQAGAANFANLGQDLMDINNDYINNVVLPKKQMEIMMPFLNRYGVVDRKYGAMDEIKKLNSTIKDR